MEVFVLRFMSVSVFREWGQCGGWPWMQGGGVNGVRATAPAPRPAPPHPLHASALRHTYTDSAAPPTHTQYQYTHRCCSPPPHTCIQYTVHTCLRTPLYKDDVGPL
jgi:hypothetical protein